MSAPSGAMMTISNVAKRFGANMVLRQVTFQANQGEFISIVGRSGSGKSTLLRLIAGLEHPDEGRVLSDGHPVEAGKDALVIFQDSRLLPWKSVIDNVGLGLGKPRDWKVAATDMLTNVGLSTKIEAWPASLSGGQRQRVALARALIRKPRLILFDEPLGALDALTRFEMQELIERLWQTQGFTAIFITHDVEEAVALADRVLVLEEGKIALDRRIALARPRIRTNPEFSALKAELLNAVMRQV